MPIPNPANVGPWALRVLGGALLVCMTLLVLFDTPSVSRAEAKTPPAGCASPRERFDAYWTSFRSAVERDDTEAVAALTRFPFETRGSDDGTPVEKHRRAAFGALLEVLLADDAGLMKPTSMRDLITATPIVADRGFLGAQARVGTFEFREVKRTWLFVRAYSDSVAPAPASQKGPAR